MSRAVTGQDGARSASARYPEGFLLSVVIPVYNERDTVLRLIERVRAVDIPKEIVVVDDSSTDGTGEILRTLDPAKVRVIRHERNRGKGAALRTGFAHAGGTIVVVQDADLEYDPEEYHGLIAPILAGKADVVYGSRFLGGRPHRVLFFWHSIANAILTLLSNAITNLNLTDMETCYKVFRADVLRRLEVEEDRFGFEPEITAKVARLGVRIYEVGISYDGRSYEEGKKIGLKDALRALWCIVKYGVLRRSIEKRPLPAHVPAPEVQAAKPAEEAPVAAEPVVDLQRGG
jgi:glycosyltransferase involved in cell wall biosynthesis